MTSWRSVPAATAPSITWVTGLMWPQQGGRQCKILRSAWWVIQRGLRYLKEEPVRAPQSSQSRKQLGRKWPADHGEEQAEHEPARSLGTQEGQEHPGCSRKNIRASPASQERSLSSTQEHLKKMEPGSSHWCPMTGQEVTIRNHFRKFHLNVRKTLLLCQRSNTGTGCTEFSIWKPQPLEIFKSSIDNLQWFWQGASELMDSGCLSQSLTNSFKPQKNKALIHKGSHYMQGKQNYQWANQNQTNRQFPSFISFFSVKLCWAFWFWYPKFYIFICHWFSYSFLD